MQRLVFLLVLFFWNPILPFAQKHTRQLAEGEKPPPASIADVSWIQGHWRGEAFGGITEEIWSPPLGGSMMCAFKLVVDNQVKFYELVTILEEKGSLILRLKHFHANLQGWEEKDETVDFRLVKIAGKTAYFEGFTFELISEDEMDIYVMIGSDGKTEETKFAYQKYP